MKLDQLIEADGASFTDLVALAELDPGRDFRGADLRGVDFTACNLAGYDFSQADLSGANLSHAQIGGAIFDGAQTTGTWWPHGGPPASTGLRLVRSGPPLHACQIEIVHSVISALLSGVMQSLVSMPVGTGRVEVMAALIEALDESDGLRTVVVLTDRVVLKEQFLSRMRDAFGQHVAELRSSRRQMSTPSPRILVGIAAAVLNAKNSKRDTQLLQNGRISHVLVDNFGRFPVILSQEVGDVFAESKVIGFTELSISEFQNRAKFDSIERTECLPIVAHVYSLERAVNDGILEPIQIELRPISVLLRQPNDISKDGHVVPVGLVKGILPLFVGQSNSESCVILCSNQGTAKELTRLIESALRLNRDGTTNRPVTIVSSSGLSGQPNRLSSYREDAILVMTSAMIRSFDWKTIALTIVLTPLSNEKLRELAFRRVRPGKLPPRRIIDYAGNVWPTTT